MNEPMRLNHEYAAFMKYQPSKNPSKPGELSGNQAVAACDTGMADVGHGGTQQRVKLITGSPGDAPLPLLYNSFVMRIIF